MAIRSVAAVLCAVSSAAGGVAGAEPVAVGSTLPALTLEDQHGEAHTLDASIRLVIFSREMGAADIVKETLAENGGAILKERQAVYVADIHKMPSVIRFLFALPSMRRRSYPMWLDTEGVVTADLPAVEGKPTLLFLENLQVKEIRNPGDVRALRSALGLPDDSGD